KEDYIIMDVRYFGTVEYMPSPLDNKISREAAVATIFTFLNVKKNVLPKSEVDKILKQYKDSNEVTYALREVFAFAIKEKILNGTSSKQLLPKQQCDGRTFCTIVLRALGYNISGSDSDVAAAILAEKGGLSIREAVRLNYKKLIRDDVIGIEYAMFNAKRSDGKTVIEKLKEERVINVKKAEEYGLIQKEAK
ncbi:MAG TPA: hypothetical protein VHT34_03870, partial [Clostridia bacterium]|nr:hypothetical protein [Clostridia bacterium]